MGLYEVITSHSFEVKVWSDVQLVEHKKLLYPLIDKILKFGNDYKCGRGQLLINKTLHFYQ